MKKIMKNPIFMFILGLLVSGVTVYAASYAADQISYKSTTVKLALDDLYTKIPKKFCELKSGDSLQIGSKYECDPGDGTKRNFYVLAVDTNKVKLIMEHNITEGSNTTTMTWMNAMKYFDTGAGASTKTSWKNVIDVDLPMAQDIANAVGNTSWKVEDNNYDGWFCLGLKDHSSCSAGNYSYTTDAGKEAVVPYQWLFNYTRNCSSFGCDPETSLGTAEAAAYWTRDIVAQQKDSTGYAWHVALRGNLGYDAFSVANVSGIRPVITVLKSNLYKVS